MILVTVGTTLPFDALVKRVDQMVASGVIKQDVICQIGPGQYVPKHCAYYRFSANMDNDVERAELVIGHGGTGTVTELIAAGKPFVAVANPLGVDNHQRQFLERLSKLANFVWTDDLDILSMKMEQARLTFPSRGSSPRLTDDLLKFLNGR